MLYLVIFFIFMCIITFIIFIKVNIVIEFLKNGNDDHCVISVFIFNGKIKFKYEIPFLSVNEEGIRLKLVKERGKNEKDTDKKESKITFSKIIDKYKIYSELIKRNRMVISNIEKYIRKKAVLKNFHLDVLLGAGEAHYTAIIAGLLWSGIGIFLSTLSKFMYVEKQKINVKYDFGNVKFLVDFDCIITFRIVHIIVVGLKLLFYYLRGKISFKIKTLGGDICG